MDVDVQKCCRICLDVENDHVSILGDPTIHLHLKSCLTMTVSSSDSLPKQICLSCVNQLNDFYNFQLNARCSQDWLESEVLPKNKRSTETKTPIQPLPDSEYNSDSLLEFLNNTANIEEYLNNLGKEDIPSIVNLLDRNEHSIQNIKPIKIPTPKKKETVKKISNTNMEIDVLEPDIKKVKEIFMKKTELKIKSHHTNGHIVKTYPAIDRNNLMCFACDTKFENLPALSQHLSICDSALRTCVQCNMLFNSKQQLQQHFLTHNTLTCNCGKQFQSKEKLTRHVKTCVVDYGAALGCSYRCKECGEVFKERINLYRHARNHIIKSEERICDICGHCFIGAEVLLQHMKEEHDKPENVLYRCKVCSFTSASHKEIYKHVEKHTQSLNQSTAKHLCESCGKSFATAGSLLRHSSQHEKVKENMCKTCCKWFPDEKSRNAHMVEHSAEIMCERCGQKVNSVCIDVHMCI